MLERLAQDASRELRLPVSSESIRVLVTGSLKPDTPFVRHPLGFAYRQLIEGAEGAYMRLHVWPANIADAGSPPLPHTHSSNLWSFILRGAIENIVWTVDDQSVVPLQPSASIVHHHDKRSWLANDPVRLRFAHRTRHSAGTTYFVPQGTFHASGALPETICATLILRGAKVQSSVVVGLTDRGRHPERAETFLTPAELVLANAIKWSAWGAG